MQGDNENAHNSPDPTPTPGPPLPAADGESPEDPTIPGEPVEVRIGGRANTRVHHAGVITRRKVDGNADDPPPTEE